MMACSRWYTWSCLSAFTTKRKNCSSRIAKSAAILESRLNNQHLLILDEPLNKVRNDYKQLYWCVFAETAIVVKPYNIVTPNGYKSAMAGWQAKEWYEACKFEYGSEVAQGTLTITTLPYDHKAIEEKWVLRLKRNLDGWIEKYKARWVAKRELTGRRPWPWRNFCV